MKVFLVAIAILVSSCSESPTNLGNTIEIEIYETKAEAEAVAAQLNCSGAHKMDNGWMPCESHDVHHHH